MPLALRSPQHLRGLPDLPAKDREKLIRSNRLADRAGQLQQLAIAYDIIGLREPGFVLPLGLPISATCPSKPGDLCCDRGFLCVWGPFPRQDALALLGPQGF